MEVSFMRRLVLGSAAVLLTGLAVPAALAKPTAPTEPSSCASDVQLSISQTTLWPPNHKLVPITITASDTDNDGNPVTGETVNVSIGIITNSDEVNGSEINGTGKPDTSPMTDQQGSGQSGMFKDPGSVSFTVELAAERSGHDITNQNGTQGRTYTIPVTCSESGSTDPSETTTSSSTVDMTVFVPHDQGNNVS
jgi:hypothetical protein